MQLLPYLLERWPQATRTRVKKWLRLGYVRVNGKTVTRHDHPVNADDDVQVQPGKKTMVGGKVQVLFEDEHVLVAEKPAGLLTVSTEKEKERTAYFELTARLRPVKERVFIVHRLDRETSGLLVFAKNPAAKFKLQKDWDRVEKHYFAVVEGVPLKKEDTLKSRLAQNKALKVYSTEDDEDSKPAVTRYRLLKTGGRFSLLDIEPKTGRKNQIRVQLSDIGHPVTGDKKYGAVLDPAGRLALHACRLSFDHPATGKRMDFTSAMPAALAKIVR